MKSNTCKNLNFSTIIFFEKFSKPCGTFSRVWTKNTFLGNFEKFSKIFKYFLRKLRKCIILAYFRENLTNALIFRAFGRKTQIIWKFWEKFEKFWRQFNRKIDFLIILGKFINKNRAFGNNTIFLQFFSVSGDSPLPLPPPRLRPWLWRSLYH